MKKLLFILSLPLLMSCGEREVRTYKVELNTGEVYHVKSTGYMWWNNGELEFKQNAGSFRNVKCVIEIKNY